MPAASVNCPANTCGIMRGSRRLRTAGHLHCPSISGTPSSKHKKHKASRLLSAFQSAKPLQARYILGDPGVWQTQRQSSERGASVCQLQAQCQAIAPEVNLETFSPTALSIKLRHFTGEHPLHESLWPQTELCSPASERAQNLKQEGRSVYTF